MFFETVHHFHQAGKHNLFFYLNVYLYDVGCYVIIQKIIPCKMPNKELKNLLLSIF